MFIWENKIPDYLIEKSNIVRLVFFTAAFALAFINIYAPFGVESWYDVSQLDLFFYSSLVILTGVLVVVISRILMYRYARKKPVNYIKYGIWVFAEIASMAVVYTVFDKFIIKDTRLITDIFKITIKNTTLVLLLPYILLWLYFSWKDKSRKLEELTQPDKPVDVTKKMISFYDEKGSLRFSILSENLLYLEASDNYVTLYYENKGGMSKFLIRNSIKNLEEYLKPYFIIRCHRSFMVNMDKVKVVRKEKDGLHLELDFSKPLDLPVSKTYVEKVIESFSNYP
ncbi:MAG: LytTR family transcriptional regulator [Bacteroidales bacterium]|nr:LytTR family transcriptional regulator [Bacteroidales bacterium]